MYPIYVPIYLSMYLCILSGVKTEQPNLPKMDPKIFQKVVPRRKTFGSQGSKIDQNGSQITFGPLLFMLFFLLVFDTYKASKK